MTKKSSAPRFRDLTRKESEKLLSANHVGRIAFTFHDAVDIRPIHYSFSDGWLFGRTSQGDKLITMRHNQWVAFEVDIIAGPLVWDSVVARGTFYNLRDEGSVHDVRLYKRGVDAVRSLSPAAFSDADPLAFRTEVFGISIDSLTGKSCSTKSKG